MATMISDPPQTAVPTSDDSRLAHESSRTLKRRLVGRNKGLRVVVQQDDEPDEAIEVPLSAVRLLADILAEMAEGRGVTLAPVPPELTTQQAADLLNVSPPFLIEQLGKGELPFHKVGPHPRFLLQDVLSYKQKRYQDSLKALDELAALWQELDMGH